jgi:hypothetical protein
VLVCIVPCARRRIKKSKNFIDIGNVPRKMWRAAKIKRKEGWCVSKIKYRSFRLI